MMKKGNDKGFSLIEIVIGIGMLAVIVVPILHTFITSAQLNRDSRQVMIQTEVAQTIMEGFAGKTFIDVKNAVNALGNSSTGEVVSGNNALSTIDNNWYNTGDTYFDYDTRINALTRQMPNLLQNVGCTSLQWNSAVIQTRNLVSDNSVMVSMNQAFADDIFMAFELRRYTEYSSGGSAGKDGRVLSYWMPDGGKALFIAYGNIHYENYLFDAVISFIPMAQDEDDMYYTYRILLTLYEVPPDAPHYDLRFKHALMTMDGGIMAGR